MLLSSLIVALATPVWALPTSSYQFDPKAALLRAEVGIKGEESGRIARLARAVDDAHCPDRSSNAVVVTRSADEEADVTWQITHDPRSHSYTLAFASPPPEDLLELLASVTPADDSHLKVLPTSFLRDHIDSSPMIYAPFSPYLDTVAEAADAMSLLVKPRSTVSRWLVSAASVFGLSLSPWMTAQPHVEVAGQGLGAVLALLAAVRLSAVNPTLDLQGTLFSMPKVGDQAFSIYVDNLASGSILRLERIAHGSDPVPSLPPPHYGLQHPSSVTERRLRDSSDSPTHGRIEDAYGPYEGIMIGLDC